MFNTTRNAPFGTDDTPQFHVKIVGGRQIEILNRENSNLQNISLSRDFSRVPKNGPHGTPPIITQPLWSAYDRKSELGGIPVRSNELHTKRQGALTQPFGDRSYSFQHGRKVLPPISNGNLSEFRSKDELENQISGLLQNYDSKKLKNIYKDMAAQDTSLSGLATDAQISLCALKHDLPLNRSTMQVLMSRFLNNKEHDLINYEELLKFLSRCKNEKLHSRHNMTSTQTFENSLKSDHGRSKTSPAVLMMTSAPYKHHDEEKKVQNEVVNVEQKENVSTTRQSSKLVQLLAANMEVDDGDLTKLRTALKELDRLQSGELPAHVIRSNLMKYRIPLTGSLIDKLMEEAKAKPGLVDWRNFMGHIISAQNMQHSKHNKDPIIIDNSPREATIKSPQESTRHEAVKRNPPWERLPLKDIPTNTNLSGHYSFRSVDSATTISLDLTNDGDSETTMSTSSSSRLQLPDGWDEHELIVKDANTVNAEPWLHKFNKLTHALRTYMPGQPDILPQNVADRVTKNYNLIYGLGFSEKKIDAALQQTVSKSDKTSQRLVPVQEFLDVLSGKKRLIT